MRFIHNSKWSHLVIKSHINCNSLNTIHYLICNSCNQETYIGKTDNMRLRTNNHISGCRLGNTTNMFDNHVYNCFKKTQKPHQEPFFKLLALLKLSNYNKLRSYEKLFHARGYDTMNK